MKACWTLTVLFTFALGDVALAGEFRLFSDGQQVADYTQTVRNLSRLHQPYSERTFLLFDNDAPIEIKGFLGRGGLTAVFRRADGRVIRIPLASGHAFFRNGKNGELKDHGSYTSTMEGFFSAMKKVSVVSAVTPKIYESESVPSEHITVDYFLAKFNILEFFERRDQLIARRLLQPNEVPGLIEGLKRFARRLAPFEHIGDFKIEQVMTNGKSWRLLDSSEPVLMAKKTDDPTPFDHWNMAPRLPPEIYAWLTELIREERARRGCGQYLARSLHDESLRGEYGIK